MYKIYFQYPDGRKDFLDERKTLPQANQYVRNQLEMEGWAPDSPEASQYIIEGLLDKD